MTKYKPRHMLVNAFGEVSRMDYSRMMFAKAYGSKDYWDNPYKEVHERIVTPKPAKKIANDEQLFLLIGELCTIETTRH